MLNPRKQFPIIPGGIFLTNFFLKETCVDFYDHIRSYKCMNILLKSLSWNTINTCIIWFWQLIVRLSDGAGRVAAQSATVTINVIRNQNTPYFINEPYSRLIQENLPTGTSIYQVTARDNDSPVSFFI